MDDKRPEDTTLSYGEKKQKKFLKNMGIVFGSIIALIVLVVVLLQITPVSNWVADFFKPDVEQNRGGLFTGDDETGGSDKAPGIGVGVDSETEFNFLVVGHDRAANLADVTMLINFDTKKGTVNIMQIPRDTYVDYDGYWYHKANGVYSYYIDNESENPELEGIKGYAEFLEKNLCVEIDYYAIMDLDQFVNIIDALGGVEIDVPFDMYYRDPHQNLTINLKAGHQVLNGAQSEQFVRYRSTYVQGDIGRGNMQKVFMAALFKTVKEKVNIFNISELCSIINENLVTNMSTSDMIYFANYAFKVDLKYVAMMTLPGKPASLGDGLSYYCANKEATLRYINAYFNIYNTEVTEDMFDKDHIFDCGGYIYTSPASEVEGIIYDAAALADGDELPPT